MHVQVLIRHNTSYLHRSAKLRLLAQATELSAAVRPWTEEMPPDTWSMIEAVSANVVGCIFGSVAHVESAVNEVFIDAAQQSTAPSIVRLSPQVNAALAPLMLRVPRKPKAENELVWKISHSLQCVEAQIDYLILQEFRLLVRLRNALTHGRPEPLPHNVAGTDTDLGRLMDQLSRRFPDAVGVTRAYPFIWTRCLGLGCAEWAVRVSDEVLAAWCGALVAAG
jgi:hypothetical protein